MRAAVEREVRDNPRYRWLGAVPHARSVELIARTRLHVLTSFSEGGANVLSESIACGVPVVSSRIPGSIGILGEAYPGFFETGDERSLAKLLERCERDAPFLAALTEWCRRLQPLVAREREQRALARLLAELLPRPPAVGARPSAESRLVELGDEVELPFTRLAASFARGLSKRPKSIDCCWFYDEEGSRLFEEICATPEYYVTRAEDAILERHARDVVAALPSMGATTDAGGRVTLVELGSGSATKTRRLIDALVDRQEELRCLMIDVSASALAASARDLLESRPKLEVVTICGDYEDGIARLADTAPSPRLVLWLGSNVGNFHRADAAAFLGRLRAQLNEHDRLLVGVDLRKEKAALERAYDDAAGVTARFNRNLLARANRELGADFDVAAFRHHARVLEEEGRVEMWLVSERRQTVRLPLLDRTVEFEAGEAVHTENSYKYSLDEIAALAKNAGLRVVAQWFDRDLRFTDVLMAPVAARASGSPSGTPASLSEVPLL
jgi:dimethylhistidine N-methyltransferase